MIFGFVPPPYGFLWGPTKDLLDGAVRRGKNEWPEVIAELMQGTAQLWLTVVEKPVAAMVTRMDGNTLEVWLAGGAVLSGSVPFLETAIKAAQADGATNGRIIGRRGWARVLRNYGWRESDDMLIKDFD